MLEQSAKKERERKTKEAKGNDQSLTQPKTHLDVHVVKRLLIRQSFTRTMVLLCKLTASRNKAAVVELASTLVKINKRKTKHTILFLKQKNHLKKQMSSPPAWNHDLYAALKAKKDDGPAVLRQAYLRAALVREFRCMQRRSQVLTARVR